MAPDINLGAAYTNMCSPHIHAYTHTHWEKRDRPEQDSAVLLTDAGLDKGEIITWERERLGRESSRGLAWLINVAYLFGCSFMDSQVSVTLLVSQVTATGHTFGKSFRFCVANAVVACRGHLQSQSRIMSAVSTGGLSFIIQVMNGMVSPLSRSPGVQCKWCFTPR